MHAVLNSAVMIAFGDPTEAIIVMGLMIHDIPVCLGFPEMHLSAHGRKIKSIVEAMTRSGCFNVTAGKNSVW